MRTGKVLELPEPEGSTSLYKPTVRTVTNTSHALGTTLTDVNALVVGLAREGTALVRFLVQRGARVTVTDAKLAAELAANLTALNDLPVTYALGGHPFSLLQGADILFVSPGVPFEIPFLIEARRRSLPVSSETRLFTRLCPAPIVGITGSSGKTTTTALVGEMLLAAGHRTWVGGNIGQPLIGHLDAIGPQDWVVMELSSFQLEFFAAWTGRRVVAARPEGKSCQELKDALFDPAGWSPPVAAVLNITPNHLDRHTTMAAYAAAKAHILAYQRSRDIAVLNLDSPATQQFGRETASEQHILWFSTQQEVPQGAFQRQGTLVLRLGGDEQVICRTEELRLLGAHNVSNALAALALAGAAGAPLPALRQTATTFSGVAHRLEMVRERHGVRWYDDSIATTPERTVAALRSFPDDSIVLLAGGRDKHLPWEELAGLTWKRVRQVILFGEAAELIEDALHRSPDSSSSSCGIHRAATLQDAVLLADQLSLPGDLVLLSPGGTSFDAFRDFAARGDHFQKLVRALE